MAFRFKLTGTPITNETLAAMPEYKGQAIGRRERAEAALRDIDKNGKKQRAINSLKKMDEELVNRDVTARCMIYNATGDTVWLVRYKDWHNSHLGVTPYPLEIANGQWGAFLHVKPNIVPTGTFGAVVFRGFNDRGSPVDFAYLWYVPWSSAFGKYCNTQVWQNLHTDRALDELYNTAKWRDRDSDFDGFYSKVTMEDSWHPKVEGIMTLKLLK